MIEVAHLTKHYPGRVAVDDVSFAVSPGEIVGFLGPNGAGKSTTMRILTGYLPATGGSVRVAGHDVAEEPMEVRRQIGYLPENCPLYGEMRVDEYLRFRARLKGVPRTKLRARVAEVKEQCGIGEVGGRIIGHLSKGYRQRVGLAESLVHDPQLLVLDEPTIGLDPHQIRLVRGLITSLAERHTILLSTHILSEVEMTCRRVLIINKGRIVASDTPDRLRRRMEGEATVTAELRGPREAIEPALRALPGVSELTVEAGGDWGRYTLRAARDPDLRPELSALAARQGWALRELRQEAATLEDVFVNLTRSDAPEARP
ncbi:MAG TPA: ATP-binding cassette domain-containing protein [Kiritimatiellia bacterium]|nr:ATP-binding cassette domain-containing protein [Kiritimatiellia bacterium]